MKKKYIVTALLSIFLSTQMSLGLETLSPKGDITTTIPTFSWEAVDGATEYELGYENDMEEGWESYTISLDDANCHQAGETCTYRPQNAIFETDTNMVWWVREKIDNQWQEWSDTSEFIVNMGELIIDNGCGTYNGTQTERPTTLNNCSNLIINNGSGVINGSHTEQPNQYYNGEELIIDDGSGVYNGTQTERPQSNNSNLIIDDGSGVINGSHTEQPYWNY